MVMEQTVLEESCRKDAYPDSIRHASRFRPPLSSAFLRSPLPCRHSGTCMWSRCISVCSFAMLMSPGDSQRCQACSYPKSNSKHLPFSKHNLSGLTCGDYIGYIYRSWICARKQTVPDRCRLRLPFSRASNHYFQFHSKTN